MRQKDVVNMRYWINLRLMSLTRFCHIIKMRGNVLSLINILHQNCPVPNLISPAISGISGKSKKDMAHQSG